MVNNWTSSRERDQNALNLCGIPSYFLVLRRGLARYGVLHEFLSCFLLSENARRLVTNTESVHPGPFSPFVL